MSTIIDNTAVELSCQTFNTYFFEHPQPRPFDEERFEQRIQKIEENLYSQEPYLAQLIKLDSIGADVLSHEREKQLR